MQKYVLKNIENYYVNYKPHLLSALLSATCSIVCQRFNLLSIKKIMRS